MDKKEILERAQLENKDEMEIYINYKSMLLVFILTEILAVIFAFINVAASKPMMIYFVLVNAPLGAGFLFRYIKTKKNFNLIMFICCVILTAGFLTGCAFGY